MSSFRRSFHWAIAICLTFALAPFAHGQLTTGSIAGSVIAADGSALPGVTVEAMHTPTGTRYDAVHLFLFSALHDGRSAHKYLRSKTSDRRACVIDSACA